MKKQDILENQAKFVYIGIGSNLGSRKKNIEKAKFLILKNNIKIIKSSSFYSTKSWPNENFPEFLNVVIFVQTNLKLEYLFKILKNIEFKLGRKITPKNYPRTCDIDIIDYANIIIKKKFNIFDLEVPHPRMHKRNFVLFPLFEINRKWQHPKFKTNIVNLITKLPQNDIRGIKLF